MAPKIAPLDVLRRTPKTNCGKCGFPACLAFAASVAAAGADPYRCPFFDDKGFQREQLAVPQENKNQQEWALIRQLQAKIKDLDFRQVAPLIGAARNDEEPETLRFLYLGQQAALTRTSVRLDGEEPEDPRDQILLYNYVHQGGGPAPAGDWVGMESLPNSISKIKTLEVYCEHRLAALLTDRPRGTLQSLTAPLQAETHTAPGTAAGAVIPVLPMVPLLVLFWEAEPEDGFEARVKILFDRGVLNFLDLESLVFAAERLTDRLNAVDLYGIRTAS